MTKREAKRWAREFAAGLLRSFAGCDTVTLTEDNEDRDDADVERIQAAIWELADRLDPNVE